MLLLIFLIHIVLLEGNIFRNPALMSFRFLRGFLVSTNRVNGLYQLACMDSVKLATAMFVDLRRGRARLGAMISHATQAMLELSSIDSNTPAD